MNARQPINIAGGGLAGLTLGIALRQRDIPVVVYEAGSYPRHRVCGEFICGRGLEVLQNLGLLEKLAAAGARTAVTASFHSGQRDYRARILPSPGLCLSRWAMDDLLAREFRRLGGELRERERIAMAMAEPGWVRATGRRAASEPAPAKWIGLKAHARKVPLAADLEMHFFPDGYVGLCRLPAGAVNVCGLFALRQPIPQLAAQWREILGGPAGSGLRERLRTAEFDPDSFSTVTALNLAPAAGKPTIECSIGDALTMIPPVTGNGMSMAFESAHWAAAPLAAYSRGELDWVAARQTIARQCATGFARRLRWAAWFQRQLMHGSRRELLLRVGNCSDWLWRICFAKTR